MTLLAKLWSWVGSLFNSLEKKTKELIPVAIKVVQGIKDVMDSPVDDIVASVVKAAIPGNADDVLIDKIQGTVKEWLPKILLELTLVEGIANIENQNDQLQAILDKIKLSSDESKNILYHGLSSLILEKLSDGKLSWSDSTAIAEYYYKNFIK